MLSLFQPFLIPAPTTHAIGLFAFPLLLWPLARALRFGNKLHLLSCEDCGGHGLPSSGSTSSASVRTILHCVAALPVRAQHASSSTVERLDSPPLPWMPAGCSNSILTPWLLLPTHTLPCLYLLCCVLLCVTNSPHSTKGG